MPMLTFRAWATCEQAVCVTRFYQSECVICLTCEKTGEKDFWRRITRDEIITDYNTKAVNVDAYQKRDNNSDTAGKGYKRNPEQMNNLFQRLCSVRSFCCRESIFSCLGRADTDTFSKSSTLPWKNR